ncbi:hypothetical protein CRX72_15640 [Pantoea sp. BRM17]|nr:hypothetical protein CRX72_15640 [Pantoea sp. BRM17]
MEQLTATVKQNAENALLWLIGAVMTVVIAVGVLCWFGLRRILIQPLNQSIQHIRHIAQGDLTQPITITGRNEMSQLATSLH